jgi:hypothetical protein
MKSGALDLTHLPSYAGLDELRLVANCAKHGDGTSCAELRERRPNLFTLLTNDPASFWDARPVISPLGGEHLYVREEDFKGYAEVVKAFLAELSAEVRALDSRHAQREANLSCALGFLKLPWTEPQTNLRTPDAPRSVPRRATASRVVPTPPLARQLDGPWPDHRRRREAGPSDVPHAHRGQRVACAVRWRSDVPLGGIWCGNNAVESGTGCGVADCEGPTSLYCVSMKPSRLLSSTTRIARACRTRATPTRLQEGPALRG